MDRKNEALIDEVLHQFLIKNKITFATAESCTGGALAARFVAQSDASKYFQGSIVAYANEVKEKMLNVKHQTLVDHGAVSTACTEEMARGVSQALEAMCAVAVSGILGPKGGTKEKPVGTICCTIFLQGFPLHSWTMYFKGSRLEVMDQTIQSILCELLSFLRRCCINHH